MLLLVFVVEITNLAAQGCYWEASYLEVFSLRLIDCSVWWVSSLYGKALTEVIFRQNYHIKNLSIDTLLLSAHRFLKVCSVSFFALVLWRIIVASFMSMPRTSHVSCDIRTLSLECEIKSRHWAKWYLKKKEKNQQVPNLK